MKTHLHILYTALGLLTATLTAHAAPDETTVPADTTACDTCHRAPYPARLISEFPVIYVDTVYTTPRYHVVARAVWKTHRPRRVKVTTPGPLPVPPDSEIVRFVPGTTPHTHMAHAW